MTITWSRILCKFSAVTVFIGHLRIAWRTWRINCWNAAYFTVSSLPRCAVAPFGTALQFTTRSCSGPQTPWNFQSRFGSVKNILVTRWTIKSSRRFSVTFRAVVLLWGIPHWWGMAELPSGEWPVGQQNHCFKI